MMKILILLLSIFIFCANLSAEGLYCTESQEIEADSSITKSQKWEDIYISFKNFRHCDDGYIAEGYSDLIVRTLAHQWDQFDILIRFISKDKDFYAFVIRHINATADKEEIEMIIYNSSKKCPKSASKICSAIENAAKEALSDIVE